MKRVSRITACATAMFVVLGLLLAWTGGQVAWAGEMTWTDTGYTGGNFILTVAWNGSNTLYAGGHDGHVYSRTGGGPWTDIGNTGGTFVYSLAWTGAALYAGCVDGHVYSKAGAGAWTDTGDTGGTSVNSLAWTGTTLYAGCIDGHVYSRTGAGAWTDTGDTGGTHVYCLAWIGATLYAGADNGHVYSKTGAGAWTDTGNTGGTPVTSLAWNGTSTIYAGCYDTHVYSKAGAGAWTDTGATGGDNVFSLAWNGTTIFAGCVNGHVYSKTGAGAWTDMGVVGLGNIDALVWTGTTLYAGSYDGHIYSKAGAGAWTDTGAAGSTNVNALVGNGTDTIYAGCLNGHVYSKTGSGSWVDTGATGADYVLSVAWNGTNTVFAGCDDGHVYSRTGAGAWVDTGGLGFDAIFGLAWNGTNTLYAGSYDGHVYSKSGAGAWVDTGVTGDSVSGLAWNGTNTIYAGCVDGHVYSKTAAGAWTDTGSPGGSGIGSILWTGTTLYTGCADGHVYKMTGAGAWTDIGGTSGSATVVDGLTWNGSTLFAGCADGHVYSKTGTGPWTDTGTPDGTSVNSVVWNGTTLFAGCDDGVFSATHTTFYFAEGTCRPDFDTYFCIQNPESTAAEVTLTYMKGDGTTAADQATVPPHSRSTVNPGNTLGTGNDAAHDFSTRVTCTNGQFIVVERPMYFNYKGVWTGGHDAVGATSPSSNFYFAEGTCRPDFDTYFCIQNPGTRTAAVTLTYMLANGKTRTQDISVPANARATLHPVDVLGTGNDAAHDFSTRVNCTNGQQIVAERPMYFNYKGVWTGGHDAVGATSPSATWYFAEGTTRTDFDPYFTLGNPGDETATVKVTYMRGGGAEADQLIQVDPHSRATLHPSDAIGVGNDADHDFSTVVTSSRPIVAERPMYFDYNGGWTGGHDAVGATAPATTFYFAEGTTRLDFDPYFCIENPGSAPADVTLTYMKGDGTTATEQVTVQPRSRSTVLPGNTLGRGNDAAHDFSTRVTSSRPIVAERPMYFNYNGVWTGGSDVVGFTP